LHSFVTGRSQTTKETSSSPKMSSSTSVVVTISRISDFLSICYPLAPDMTSKRGLPCV